VFERYTIIGRSLDGRGIECHELGDGEELIVFIAGIHGGGASSSGGMSAQEKYVDSIHDRETFHDPSTVTGTSQHGYSDHHWSDGWGNYLHTDNPNIDPNIGSTIQWQELQRVE